MAAGPPRWSCREQMGSRAFSTRRSIRASRAASGPLQISWVVLWGSRPARPGSVQRLGHGNRSEDARQVAQPRWNDVLVHVLEDHGVIHIAVQELLNFR